ncbi:MAG: Lrp/AsnC family transcriptional regulator [Candidatus Thermoplasmatota archaeon]|jgi:DNA-binding Lrp family transcriptional regulator|nr:Lrp/AsnC family transcriptional regulator [Candidatus Thermoplasmatota archaeon]MCL5794495.1 Lrp/AsnC family transcriptional regulator [Candidatus Thermoplasmatota archaeon]
MKGIDERDRMILDFLKDEGRAKISEISNKLNIPRATVFEKLEKLRENGVITKFTVNVDYEKLGTPVLAYIMINFDPRSSVNQRDLARRISRFGNVLSVSIIAGQWDLLILTVNRSMRDLSMFVLDSLRSLEGVENTLSIPIFESIL